MDDAEWFTAMYRLHYEAVERYLRRRAPDVEVPDVVATVFLTAWRRIQEMRDADPLPWLYRVASNALANEVRSQYRRRQLDTKVRGTAPPEDSADHSNQVITRVDLLKIIDALPEVDREILRLVAWEGLSVSGAAKVLGRKRTAVAMRILRLRRQLIHRPTSRGTAARVDTVGVHALRQTGGAGP